MALTADSKVKDLVNDPEVLALIDEYIPNFSTNKQLKMAYSMTLRSVCSFPQAGISKDDAQKLFAAIEAFGH